MARSGVLALASYVGGALAPQGFTRHPRTGVPTFSNNRIGAGLAAISLVWSLNFSDYLIWFIRVHASLEMSLNAVERVGEYLAIEQEAPPWPSAGAISVKNLELRYAQDLDPVLKDVSVDIPGGSKVGIVGRTGAGKSSFTLGLFRIVEPSAGAITIDGINNGADVNKRNKLKATPLMWASMEGHLSIVELLVEKGAEVGAKSETGMTSRQAALEKGHTAIAEFLGAEEEFLTAAAEEQRKPVVSR
ncbi:hypothetical protein HDU96_009130 [Phlyctochytrium bullatum]|nr:hypothetical protein HDU96_009130 [Phlyctochytrium bullatum]